MPVPCNVFIRINISSDTVLPKLSQMKNNNKNMNLM